MPFRHRIIVVPRPNNVPEATAGFPSCCTLNVLGPPRLSTSVRQQCHDQHLTSLEVVRRASLSRIRRGSGWIIRCLRLVVHFWRLGSPALGRRNLVGVFRRSRTLGRDRNDTVIALYVRICRRLIAVFLPCVITDAIPLFLVLPGGWGDGRLSDLPNKRSGVDAGRASLFVFRRAWPGATHRER